MMKTNTYKDLTIEDFKKAFDEYFNGKDNNPNDRNFVGHIGNGWYSLGNGGYTTKEGFLGVQKAIQKQLDATTGERDTNEGLL